MAMITTEKEAKKTKVDCVVLVILQRISFIIITIENGYHTKSWYLTRPYRPPPVYEVQESEGHGEQAEEDVGESHVGDQDVPGGLHQLISEW